jgi:CheY-like chemotaxis protein
MYYRPLCCCPHLIATSVAVESALSGEDALAKIGACKVPFDLVICDLQMPGMSGLEVLRALRSREDTRDTAVILMSAADSLDVVYRALQAGADYFLIKPVKREMIQNLWQNVAMKRRETRWHSQRDQELEVLRHRVGADLETPITSVLQVMSLVRISACSAAYFSIQRIERLMNSPNLTDEVREALLGILKALSASDLHRPIIHRHLTQDMRVWLDDPLSYPSSAIDFNRVVARRHSPLPTNALPQPSSPAVPPSSSEIKMDRLQSLLQWDFNIFDLADKDLEELFPQMLAHLRLIELFRINLQQLRTFVSRVRQRYVRP